MVGIGSKIGVRGIAIVMKSVDLKRALGTVEIEIFS